MLFGILWFLVKYMSLQHLSELLSVPAVAHVLYTLMEHLWSIQLWRSLNTHSLVTAYLQSTHRCGEPSLHPRSIRITRSILLNRVIMNVGDVV